MQWVPISKVLAAPQRHTLLDGLATCTFFFKFLATEYFSMRPAPEGHTHGLSRGWNVVAATIVVVVSSAAQFYPSAAWDAESKVLSIIPDDLQSFFKHCVPCCNKAGPLQGLQMLLQRQRNNCIPG